MAGPLGVSHLLLFSRSSSSNLNLRLALTPRGPTLHFRVEKYSLCKDVRKAQKHAKGGGKEYQNPPLLVMNNFTSPPPQEGQPPPAVPKHLENLTTTVFQSLFPPIVPSTTPLSSIRRVLLLNREPTSTSQDPDPSGSYTITLRHYAITTKRTGLSKSLRRLNAAEQMLNERRNPRAGVPNLSKLNDVADFLLDPSAAGGGFTSGSDTSDAETDAEVEIMERPVQKVISRSKKAALHARSSANSEPVAGRERTQGPLVEKRAVKLVELGPRMRLRMTKVEEGVCMGKVLWHSVVKKSAEEEKAMEGIWKKRKEEKEERKRVQRENVERKRKEKEGKRRERKKDGDAEKVNGEELEDESDDEDDWDSDDFEDQGRGEVNGEGDAMDVDAEGGVRVAVG